MREAVTPFDRPASRRWSRWVPAAIVLALVMVYIVSTRSAPIPPGWSDDYEAALTEAADSQHNVLIAFHLRNCPPCVAMERFVLSSAIVQESLERYTPVVVDANRRYDLAQRYGVYGTPTYAIIDVQGNLIDKVSGYQGAEGFARFLDTDSRSSKPINRRPESVSRHRPNGD